MSKEQIQTEKAPQAIGPYSQGIKAGGMVFISGQLPLDSETGSLVEGTIGERTVKVMNNIKAIAEEAGVGLDRIVKTTIFLTDLGNFKEVNEAYGSFFTDAPPARATIQVAALPLGSDVEIEAIAVL